MREESIWKVAESLERALHKLRDGLSEADTALRTLRDLLGEVPPNPVKPQPFTETEKALHKIGVPVPRYVNDAIPQRTETRAVLESSPLRDRILKTLRTSAATSSGLASLLDVKELVICQTLSAMEREATIKPDPVPEAGRRAQLWRIAEPSPQ